ncbi:hypothetical protein MMEU_1650 [Mycobacterium marinum str. Europe]|nr:hypothetical protein MMEU_1650 [Mycobacterium marinum str. Europe]
MLTDRSVSGPAARGRGHSALVITPPSRHKSILSYLAAPCRQPGVARPPCLPAVWSRLQKGKGM